MIRGRGQDRAGRPILFIGLSGENMTRLLADEPITFDTAEVGLPPLGVVIVGGRTERVIAEQMERDGLIGPGSAARAHDAATATGRPVEVVEDVAGELRAALGRVAALRTALAELGGYCCPRCAAISFHPQDLEHGYCGRCHAFTGQQSRQEEAG